MELRQKNQCYQFTNIIQTQNRQLEISIRGFRIFKISQDCQKNVYACSNTVRSNTQHLLTKFLRFGSHKRLFIDAIRIQLIVEYQNINYQIKSMHVPGRISASSMKLSARQICASRCLHNMILIVAKELQVCRSNYFLLWIKKGKIDEKHQRIEKSQFYSGLLH